MPDHVTFKRGEKAVFAGTNIAHKEWVSASKTGKIRLLADSISASLKRIKAIHLPSEDLKTLLVFVELVTHTLNAKHQN